MPWCNWGSQAKWESHRTRQPSLSSRFLSRATVRSLHDHKSILWFFLLHDSYSLSAFPQQPLKFQQPTYGLTVTSSLLPNHPIKVHGCLIEWFSHYHLSNQNLANSLPWRNTSLVYTLSFSTPWLCTPIFPFLVTNFKCLSLHTILDDSQVSKLKPELLPANKFSLHRQSSKQSQSWITADFLHLEKQPRGWAKL